MFANVLYFAFVSAFVVIVLTGHVLLLFAVWPSLLPKPRRPAVSRPSADIAAAAVQPSAKPQSPKLAA